MKKVVLVTGASSGFGRSIAMLLKTNGYDVFGTSRKPGSSDDFGMLSLDVTSDSSVKACVLKVLKKTGRIDVLVNNAGYISSGALEESSIKEAKSQFETNFFGVVRMTDAVLPIMRRQRSGQIINIGSLAGTIPAPFQGFYAQTKATINSYSEVLRLEVKHLGIKVSVIEPGFFSTNLFKISKGTSKQIPDYKRVKRRALAVLKSHSDKGSDPAEVADLVLRLIETKSPRLHYPVGTEKVALLAKTALPQATFEKILRSHWQLD